MTTATLPPTMITTALFPRNDTLPIIQEAGWAPISVWTGAENISLPVLDPQTVQAGVSHCTDWATQTHPFKVAANKINRQSRTAENGWTGGIENPRPKKTGCKTLREASELDRFFWNDRKNGKWSRDFVGGLWGVKREKSGTEIFTMEIGI
jgi:hypothetical protein